MNFYHVPDQMCHTEHMKSEGGGRERKERERIQRRKEKEEERG